MDTWHKFVMCLIRRMENSQHNISTHVHFNTHLSQRPRQGATPHLAPGPQNPKPEIRQFPGPRRGNLTKDNIEIQGVEENVKMRKQDARVQCGAGFLPSTVLDHTIYIYMTMGCSMAAHKLPRPKCAGLLSPSLSTENASPTLLKASRGSKIEIFLYVASSAPGSLHLSGCNRKANFL